MKTVFQRKCLGCENDSLSQTSHTCLDTSESEKLELYFSEIVDTVDERDVLRKWGDAVDRLDYVSPGLIVLYKQKIYCDDWRATDMKSESWKNRVIRMTIRTH